MIPTITANPTPNGCRVHIIIVAAGSGSRFGADVPKQYCLLDGRPVLMHTINAMRRAVPGADVRLVISENMHPLWNELCSEHRFASPTVVYGGDTRWASVRNAIESLQAAEGDTVLIHDGARPLTDEGTVHRVIETARAKGACVPTVPVTDSLRAVASDGTTIAVDRAAFRAVQTPQGFEASAKIRAYALPYSPAFTDDASVYEADGGDVAICDGATDNIKITNAGDIEVAELLLRRRQSTVGADKR